MKIKFIIVCGCVMLFLNSCDWQWRLSDQAIHTEWICPIFKFNKPEYAEYVVTLTDRQYYDHLGVSTIHNDTDLYFNEASLFIADTTNICEFAITPKLIELHDGFYMWYPYSSLGDYMYATLRDVKWEELCNDCNLYYYDELQNSLKLSASISILGGWRTMYKEYYKINGRALNRFNHKNPNKMTLDDIIQACNKIIDKEEYKNSHDIWNPFEHLK